jgi:endonuclease IV
MQRPHVHVPFDKIQEHIDFIIKSSLDLEIYFSSLNLDNVSHKKITALSKMLSHSPSLSIHAPFIDLSPGAVDSSKTTIERFSHVLDISETKSNVFHSGYEKWKYALNIDLWLEKSLMTWQPLNKRATAMGVKIAIENIFEDEPANLKLLMEKMNSENFGICFDTGHFHLFSRVPLGNWMSALKTYT